jgi:hypothetical protein
MLSDKDIEQCGVQEGLYESIRNADKPMSVHSNYIYLTLIACHR